MQTVNVDIAIVGAGGGGLRAAIAAAEANPNLKIALVSKVYPMRSHTVAAEGGAAAVISRLPGIARYIRHCIRRHRNITSLCDEGYPAYGRKHQREQIGRAHV